MMTTGNRSARRLWPRRWCVTAAGLMALAYLSGCSHNRSTTYRPIFARRAVAAPCTNCGSGATVTTEGATTVAPPATVPTIPNSPIDSSVNPSSAIRPGSGAVRNSTVEAAPQARPGPEPEFYDDYPASSLRNSAKPPASPPAPASPGTAPKLERPTSGQSGGPATWNVDGQDARLSGRSGSGPQPASSTGLAARLEPYISGSSARELFYPDKADRPWRFIVLHHSASSGGSYDEIDREHRKQLGFDGCGYHFVIGNGNGSGDGVIEVAQRWNNQKAGVHCRNARSHDVDEYGIGICLIGDLDQQPPTPRQVAATQALVAFLGRRYTIDPARMTTHSHLAATPTVCPGKFFPATILAVARNQGPGAS
jgi:N-acetylmuramoyl-L-alanine amidase